MNQYPIILAGLAATAPAVPLQQGEPPVERLINGLALLLLIFIVGLCLVAFIMVINTLLPDLSEQSKGTLQQSPWRAFFIGLANYLFLGGISLILLSTEVGPLVFVAIIVIAFLAIITSIGLAGLVRLTGERLAKLYGQEISPLRQLGWGASVLILASLLPFLGWFLLAPILLMLSFGAVILAWRNRTQKELWE